MKEVSERPFSADGIADQQGQKIQRFIAAEATSHQADLMRKGFQKPFGCEVLGQDDDFGEPGRHRWTVNRRGLHLNTGVGYHTQRDLLLREDMVSFSIRGLFTLYAARLLSPRCASRGNSPTFGDRSSSRESSVVSHHRRV